mmetsp:Transcript_11849/g.25445  ORF Transcript_11849/g.25445 Transcript_11849/m.25445 type:complete len:301 (+) Transcript_11849:67-969(+)
MGTGGGGGGWRQGNGCQDDVGGEGVESGEEAEEAVLAGGGEEPGVGPEGHARRAGRVARERHHLVPRLGVVHPYGVAVGEADVGPALVEGHVRRLAPVRPQVLHRRRLRPLLRDLSEIPHLDSVLRAGGEVVAVLREGQRVHRALVRGEGDDVVLGLDVPHPHQAVRRPGPQDEPVRMELRVAVAGKDVGVLDVGAAGACRDVVEGPALVARRGDEELAGRVDRDARHVRRVLLERVRRGARGRIPNLDGLVGRGREGDVFGRVEEDAGDFLGVPRHGRNRLAAAAVQQHNLVVGAAGQG